MDSKILFDPVNGLKDEHEAQGIVSGFLVLAIGGATLIIGNFIVTTINASVTVANNSGQSLLYTTIAQAFQIGGVAMIAVGGGLAIRALTVGTR
jgi:hypothetical protein